MNDRVREAREADTSEIPIEVTPIGGNVFEDIGFDPEEAGNLKLRSTLMIAIEQIVEERGLKQREAAELFRTTQPRVSDVMRGKIGELTVDSLVNMLSHAGARIEVRVTAPVSGDGQLEA